MGALAGQGLISRDRRPGPDEFTAALYGYLARTPSLLVGVSLAEAVGERRSQNMPGTTTQYPNWKVPLSGPSGYPVLLEDLPGISLLGDVVQAVSPVGNR
jgi:4-alpha-glucanotransferase